MNIKEYKSQTNNAVYNGLKGKDCQKQFESYFYCNLMLYANNIKKCMVDLDTQSDARFIKKSDKIFIETHLKQVYNMYADKIENVQIVKNTQIKKVIQNYLQQYQNLNNDIKILIAKKSENYIAKKQKNIQKNLKQLATIHNKFSIKYRKRSIKSQTINTQMHDQINGESKDNRKIFTSKKDSRNKQQKNYFGDILNNVRYMKKLQKIKYQSALTDLQFENPQDKKNNYNFSQNTSSFMNLRKDWNKLKLITSMKSEFQTIQQKTTNSQNCNYYQNGSFNRSNQYNFNQNVSHFNSFYHKKYSIHQNNVVSNIIDSNSTNCNFQNSFFQVPQYKKNNKKNEQQLRKMSQYKPKSKCRIRNQKRLLKF